ncbi:MAG: VCBS repeat-containing protein [Proteobacteria bacterium]|nr:VCBS repeat-containing protein [Pseudomonadota bacterium]MBU1716500.1 VCBS repeat-containing protein [Pseudomonadota bacterium]
MKIARSAIKLTSSHVFREEHFRQESIRFWSATNNNPDSANNEKHQNKIIVDSVRVRISKEAREQHIRNISPEPLAQEDIDDTMMEDPQLRTMRLILEGLTGKKIKINQFQKHEVTQAPEPVTTENNVTMPPTQGWGVEYDLEETYLEQEKMWFAAQGQVITTDGKEINFRVDLNLSREFMTSTKVTLQAGDARLVDPLVINFNGPAAELTDLKFDFDLDGNGENEEINAINANSGYLVFDRNQDGKINSGQELFGPATGNGFDELKQLDSDGNGWLDENDPLYEKLQIWVKDAAGSDYLYSLKEKNIGGILLESEATLFSYKNSDNNLRGQLKASSIFLRENGTAGTIQEIDLAV